MHRTDPQQDSVLLLGWGGATAAQMDRYAAWYEARGWQVTVFVLPTIVYLLLPSLGRRIVAKLLPDLNERLILVHLFSNNGIMAWHCLQLEAAKAGRRLSPSYMIFDCAPGFNVSMSRSQFARHFAAGFSALSGASKNDGLIRRIWGLVFKLHALFRTGSYKEIAAWSQSFNNPVGDQAMFLYSNSDRVVPVRSVKSYIDVCRQKGQSVVEHEWSGVRHVTLGRVDAARYFGQIERFIPATGMTKPGSST